MNTKIHYDNATSKQRQFIERKIYESLHAQGPLVEMLLQKEIFSHDDIINLYTKRCTYCGRTVFPGVVEKCCEYESEEKYTIQTEPQEILEWYLVTDSWIAKKVIELGEPVLSNDYDYWWGRTCSGQAIFLDPTFWIIYQDSLKHIE